MDPSTAAAFADELDKIAAAVDVGKAKGVKRVVELLTGDRAKRLRDAAERTMGRRKSYEGAWQGTYDGVRAKGKEMAGKAVVKAVTGQSAVVEQAQAHKHLRRVGALEKNLTHSPLGRRARQLSGEAVREDAKTTGARAVAGAVGLGGAAAGVRKASKDEGDET